MPLDRGHGLSAALVAAALALAGMPATADAAETVTLKSGVVYRGDVDKDNTIVQIFDPEGLRRIILRDTKIARTESTAPIKVERFALVQPMTVHGGQMPPDAIDLESGEWDAYGRRSFQYLTTRSRKPIRMTQAINDLGPFSVGLRGVDGFWQGRLATGRVPKEVVLGLLAKVDPKLLSERQRVARFLIQAEWFPEARAELRRLAKDFPEFAPKAREVIQLVEASEARNRLTEIGRLRQAQQPGAALGRLKAFPEDGAPSDVLVDVREQLRQVESQADADRALADDLSRAADGLKSDDRKALQGRLVAMLRSLSEAPDAVRERFDAFRKAEAGLAPEARFALALSGWLVGSDAAVADPAASRILAEAHDALADYLASPALDESTRIDRLATLRDLRLPGGKPIGLETLTRVVRLMPPPLQTEPALAAGKVKLLRVRDDPNPNQPTEYAVLLPPEYHPMRSYPALIVLHGDETPEAAVQTWAAEATRRGVIVIAPEYNLNGRGRHYHYSAAEHAAVELALRDALRRFAIDPDRVFLAGELFGGNMAWDFGLAHPDLFAGVAILSGLPEKYPWVYRMPNAKLVPLYIVNGDLAPVEDALVFNMMAKPMISKNYEVIYIKYNRRGLEAFPEEVPNVFDWMNGRRRDPAPATFEAVSARESDDRFHGLVIRAFEPRRATPPEVADPLGKNLHPATLEFKARSKANLLLVTTRGVRRLDLWLSPRQFDFDQKLEVRVNNRTLFKGQAVPDLGAFLEDLRIRGDRQQVYWLRLSYPPARGKS